MSRQKTAAALAAIVVLGGAVSARATIITFENLDTSGPFAGNGAPFTTYSEAGYAVSAPAGEYVQSNSFGGGAPPGLSILTGSYDGTQDALLTITGAGLFDFGGFDALENGEIASGNASYFVQGYVGDVEVYGSSGFVTPRVDGQLTTINDPFAGLAVDRVTISTSSPGQLFLDNLKVSAVTPAAPEPTTWALMMAGVGLAGAALRRRRAVRLLPA